MEKKKSFTIFDFLMLFSVLILPSPILYNLGLKVRWGSFLLIIITIVEILIFNRKTNKILYLLFIIFFTMGFGAITALHYINLNYIFILSALIGYAFFIIMIEEDDLLNFIDLASIFILILEIGALIGFIYAFLGGESVFFIKNPDERENHLYLTTFTNASIGRFIRPSGIYDEPGAFSFYICAISVLRQLYKKDSFLTFVIMLLGITTTSLTHIICFFIMLFPIFKKFSKKQIIIALVFILVFIFLIIIQFYDLFDKLLFQRLKFDTNTGTIKGNSRAGQIDMCLKSIEENGFLFGNYSLGPEMIQQKYGTIGENPLSPLAINGLFNSVVYYMYLVLCGVALVFSFKLEYLVMGLLFVQRPYQSQLGYSFFFLVFMYFGYLEIKNNSRAKLYFRSAKQ